jgi:8-oxo-dGTP pyrophosphatase MutT (NUDIX family)
MSSGKLRTQYAALPFRRRDEANIEVMLITSRDTGRWVIPKGWPVPKLTPSNSAALEAREEGGLIGRIGEQPIGRFYYDKRLSDGSSMHCEVEVFALEVERQMKSWLEKGQRRTRWFSAAEAAHAVEEPELQALIANLPKFLK